MGASESSFSSIFESSSSSSSIAESSENEETSSFFDDENSSESEAPSVPPDDSEEHPTGETTVDFSDKTMACLGDSITYGYVTKKGGQYENPYPKLLKETLGLKECYNYGKGGSNLATYNGDIKPFVERVKDMPTDLDIIAVMGGTNDWGNGVPLGTLNDEDETTVYGALLSIAEYLVETYPQAYIVFMSPIPRKETWVNSQGYKMSDVAVAVKEVAELYGFGFLDMYSLSGFENEMKTDSTDGVHPSQEYIDNTLAPTIAQFIKDNYTPPIDFSNKTMACLGDSITFGYNGDLVIPMENPYPNEIKNILNLKHVDNFGICCSALAGTQYTPMWERVKSYDGDYDILSLMGGINDFGYAYALGNMSSDDTNTIYGALKSIAQTLKSEHKESFIFFMTPLKCDFTGLSYKYPNAIGISLTDIVQAVKDVAADYNIPVLDLYQFSDFNPSTDSYNGDGLHPSQEFMNQSLALQIAQFIKDNYKEKRAS